METDPLYPFHASPHLLRYWRLPLHTGLAVVGEHGDPDHPTLQLWKHFQRANGQSAELPKEFLASVFMPAASECVILLHSSSDYRLGRDFGTNLRITGDSSDGPFVATCAQYCVRANSASDETPAWAVAGPVNGPLEIAYGPPRPIARVVAQLNNFDFEHGNVPVDAQDPDRRETIRVCAAGRTMDFTWGPHRRELRRLLDAEILSMASLTTISFDAWDGAAEADLFAFAHESARLCCIVAQQHTTIPVWTFLDKKGCVVKRCVVDAITSPFRRTCILPILHADHGLPQLFLQCFEEHVRLDKGDCWCRMPNLCATIEDPPYLETKYATLMGAVELLIRNSLLEAGLYTEEQLERMEFPKLVGAARQGLQWTFPKHYTAKERTRKIRNAVAHGDDLPHNPEDVRHDFDKWILFLARRLLIRLGYDGKVVSPNRGYKSSSTVDDFSEVENTFGS